MFNLDISTFLDRIPGLIEMDTGPEAPIMLQDRKLWLEAMLKFQATGVDIDGIQRRADKTTYYGAAIINRMPPRPVIFTRVWEQRPLPELWY